MRAREYYLAESRNHKFGHRFVPWVAEQLGITELPKIKLLDAPTDTTFGQYDPETQSLSIVIANRHPIDVLRTLAHELTHHKQNLEGKLTAGAGETGTPEENEANANAGVVMRDFAKANPEYFGLEKSSITEEAFNGIDISIEIQKDDEYVDDDDYDNQVMYVTATSNGRELGYVLFAFDGDELLPQDLEVDERYRGQGIAQTMYDYVKSKGYKIRRSGQQTDAGAGFWAKHRPGQNVWEAFDQPYQIKWEKGDFGDYDALAQLEDGNYLSIMFNKGYNKHKQEGYSVEFWRNNSQEVTGEGDAQRVFATVLKAIQQFIKKTNPGFIMFSAEKETDSGPSESRSKLYSKLVQRYATAWGYSAHQQDNGNKVIYELNKRDQAVEENFADGKHPGRKGLAKRSGVNTKASVSSLRKTAKHSTGEKARMAHWLANMKAGKARAKKK